MNPDEPSREEVAANFLDLLATRPAMVLEDDRHLLHRLQAFIAGIKWSAGFTGIDMQTLATFLVSVEPKLSTVLLNSTSGVGWVDALLEKCDHDEQRAFAEAVSIITSLANEGAVASRLPRTNA